ncbi:CorA family divalent cation transporter [Sinanaerobacter chloroacetimidivorans]|jgi:magnesium transporter|uniref:Magnesium transporter n=1 Tax=Sinanaerobacter chloroacetimidivorans TaxID=2818044 RepID=A0A8J7W2E7_9FIRM|nr:CorA family divalent cation transporter [Sinanaerobacter chloroacetimidivorans]MBR0599179.1 magnesium transporter [Sinanaerobacter chloroacetimidivorans]
MIYYLDGTAVDKNTLKEEEMLGKYPCIGVLNRNEVEAWNPHLGISDRVLAECLTGQASKFESHDGFDYICLLIPDKTNLMKQESKLSIYVRENILIFICEEEQEYTILAGIIAKIELKEIKSLTLERVLYEFFDQLTAGDSLYLESLEQEISDLEEYLITSVKKDYTREIIKLRKKLLALKRYYEQLLDIAEAIEENENELLTKKMVRYFHILTTRINRLSDSVSNLRDYVSQVREAYQAQVDISQNSIMKLFTVITSIFLPLTLIVGWYGMNFPLPEYKWAYGYPAVIILSVTVALFSTIYFKKNKWF